MRRVMAKWLQSLSLFCLVSFSTVAVGAQWNVDEFKINEKKLQRGEIQTFEKTFSNSDQGEGETMGVMGVILINAPYDLVWGVISDWEAQGDFVPGLEYFKTKHVFPNATPSNWHSLIEGKLDIPFVSFRYTLDAQFDKDKGTMVWDLLNADEIQRYQQEKVDFLDSAIKSLTNRGFNLKAAIDWEKFKMGV